MAAGKSSWGGQDNLCEYKKRGSALFAAKVSVLRIRWCAFESVEKHN